MALHFVSTSVLSSEDGIGFSKEQAVESDEVRNTRLLSERGKAKTLYEQLGEKEAKKKEEYDANTKLIFAPPKALDDEDIQFLSALASSKTQQSELRATEERNMLREFRSHQRDSSSSSSSSYQHNISIVMPEKRKDEEPSVIVPVIVKKRRIDHIVSAVIDTHAINSNSNHGDVREKRSETSAQQDGEKLIGRLLGGYGSDSD